MNATCLKVDDHLDPKLVPIYSVHNTGKNSRPDVGAQVSTSSGYGGDSGIAATGTLVLIEGNQHENLSQFTEFLANDCKNFFEPIFQDKVSMVPPVHIPRFSLPQNLINGAGDPAGLVGNYNRTIAEQALYFDLHDTLAKSIREKRIAGAVVIHHLPLRNLVSWMLRCPKQGEIDFVVVTWHNSNTVGVYFIEVKVQFSHKPAERLDRYRAFWDQVVTCLGVKASGLKTGIAVFGESIQGKLATLQRHTIFNYGQRDPQGLSNFLDLSTQPTREADYVGEKASTDSLRFQLLQLLLGFKVFSSPSSIKAEAKTSYPSVKVNKKTHLLCVSDIAPRESVTVVSDLTLRQRHLKPLSPSNRSKKHCNPNKKHPSSKERRISSETTSKPLVRRAVSRGKQGVPPIEQHFYYLTEEQHDIIIANRLERVVLIGECRTGKTTMLLIKTVQLLKEDKHVLIIATLSLVQTVYKPFIEKHGYGQESLTCITAKHSTDIILELQSLPASERMHVIWDDCLVFHENPEVLLEQAFQYMEESHLVWCATIPIACPPSIYEALSKRRLIPKRLRYPVRCPSQIYRLLDVFENEDAKKGTQVVHGLRPRVVRPSENTSEAVAQAVLHEMQYWLQFCPAATIKLIGFQGSDVDELYNAGNRRGIVDRDLNTMLDQSAETCNVCIFKTGPGALKVNACSAATKVRRIPLMVSRAQFGLSYIVSTEDYCEMVRLKQCGDFVVIDGLHNRILDSRMASLREG